MFRRALSVCVTVMVLALPSVALASDSCTLSVNGSGTTVPIGEQSGVQQRRAQSFIVNSTGTLIEVRAQQSANVGSPTGPIYWEVRGSLPGSILGSGSFTSSPSSEIVATVTGGPVLTAGNTYYFVLYADTQTSGNRYVFQVSATTTYADGQIWASTNGGSSWSSSTLGDMQIRIVTDGLCSTPTPTAFVSPTPTETLTPTATNTPDYFQVATFEAVDYPMTIKPQATLGEITVSGLIIVLICLIGVLGVIWLLRR